MTTITRLAEEGHAMQKTAVTAFHFGFIKLARSREVSFPELMMGQGWLVSRMVAQIVRIAEEDDAVAWGEKVLDVAKATLRDFVREARQERQEEREAALFGTPSAPLVIHEEKEGVGPATPDQVTAIYAFRNQGRVKAELFRKELFRLFRARSAQALRTDEADAFIAHLTAIGERP